MRRTGTSESKIELGDARKVCEVASLTLLRVRILLQRFFDDKDVSRNFGLFVYLKSSAPKRCQQNVTIHLINSLVEFPFLKSQGVVTAKRKIEEFWEDYKIVIFVLMARGTKRDLCSLKLT